MNSSKLGVAGRFARLWMESKLTPLFIVASVLLGAFSVWKLPREEEPPNSSRSHSSPIEGNGFIGP